MSLLYFSSLGVLKNLTRTREKHFYSVGKEMIEKNGVSLIKDLLETVFCQL